MTNFPKTGLGQFTALALCIAFGLTACSLPSLPFGATPTPHPIEVTIFATEPPPAAETPEPAAVEAQPAATALVLPTTAPTAEVIAAATTETTATPFQLDATATDLPIVLPTETPAATATPSVIIVTVVVTVVVTAPAIAATAAPTTVVRGTKTATPVIGTPTASAKKTATPTRVRPPPVRVATLAPAASVNLSNVIAVTYKSVVHSDPWGMPFNADGCTQFDDRRPARKVYLALIVHALSSSAGN